MNQFATTSNRYLQLNYVQFNLIDRVQNLNSHINKKKAVLQPLHRNWHVVDLLVLVVRAMWRVRQYLVLVHQQIMVLRQTHSDRGIIHTIIHRPKIDLCFCYTQMFFWVFSCFLVFLILNKKNIFFLFCFMFCLRRGVSKKKTYSIIRLSSFSVF